MGWTRQTQRWLKPVYSVETLCNTAKVFVAKLRHLALPWRSRWRLACHRELYSLGPTLAPHIALITPTLNPLKPECECVFLMCKTASQGWRQRESGDLFSWTLFLHPSDSFPYFWNTNGRSRWSACIRRLGVGAPSLLLCRSHLLPSLFALLSVAFSCRPINHAYAYTRIHTLTYPHICQQLAPADI